MVRIFFFVLGYVVSESDLTNMKDILIIFTVLLLLLITISTLGGSLSFVAKNGRNEYYTDASTAQESGSVSIPQPGSVKKQEFTHQPSHAPSHAAKKAASFTQPTSPAVTKTVVPAAKSETFADKIASDKIASDKIASDKVEADKTASDKIEGFEGPMYATA